MSIVRSSPSGFLSHVLQVPVLDLPRALQEGAAEGTARRVDALMRILGLSVERLTYRLFFLLPIIVLSRIPGMLRARRGIEAPRSDLHRIPGRLTGAALYKILEAENRRIARGLTLPCGSSVFAIGRRRR